MVWSVSLFTACSASFATPYLLFTKYSYSLSSFEDFGAKVVEYKKEQKVPNGIELYDVNRKTPWIRFICFETDLSTWKIIPFTSFNQTNSFFMAGSLSVFVLLIRVP
ncbi:hypothetical protein BK708_04780 [Bacillus thuringiensis serovar yunnanensis]|nr:hypothetical protein BK708_04780 [Bacillus thuringiensis serovar yunnanensis]